MRKEAEEKLKTELEQITGNKSFGEAIHNFITTKLEDVEITVRVMIEEKTLKECLNYIINYAKSKQSNKCAALTDEDVFDKVLEYYRLDEIKPEDVKSDYTTKVDKKEIQTKEVPPEIAKECTTEIKKPKTKIINKALVEDQISLFDQLGVQGVSI